VIKKGYNFAGPTGNRPNLAEMLNIFKMLNLMKVGVLVGVAKDDNPELTTFHLCCGVY